MAKEGIAIAVDSKTVTTAGTVEALTTRDILCSSVFIRPLVTNTRRTYVVDLTTTTQKFELPNGGHNFSVNNPSLIKIDVDLDGEGVDWVAT